MVEKFVVALCYQRFITYVYAAINESGRGSNAGHLGH